MSEMVERVAEALAQSFRETVAKVSGDSWEATGVTLPSKEVWDRYARAAIEAMRDVPVPMRKFHTPGGELIDLYADCGYCGGHKFTWLSLIDKALE